MAKAQQLMKQFVDKFVKKIKVEIDCIFDKTLAKMKQPKEQVVVEVQNNHCHSQANKPQHKKKEARQLLQKAPSHHIFMLFL